MPDQRPSPAGQLARGIALPYLLLLAASAAVAVVEVANGPTTSWGGLDAVIVVAAVVAAIWLLVRGFRRGRRTFAIAGLVGLLVSPVFAWLALIVYVIVAVPSRLAGR